MAEEQIYYLQGRTNLSDLFEQFDEEGDTKPIIECSGYDLVLNEGCDASAYNIKIQNSGSTNKFILEDKSRIKLGGALPSNVCPWIDPDNPLPYCDPVTGDYETGLTANARCEIQLNGNFGLGGGSANLPTETRPGAFWVKVAGISGLLANQFILGTDSQDRELNVHPGDILQNYVSYSALQKVEVTHYDQITKVVTVSPNPSRRTVGDYWVLVAGGVCINHITTNGITMLTAPMKCGTLVLTGVATGRTGTNNNIIGDRVIWSPNTTVGSNGSPFCTTGSVFIKCKQFTGIRLFTGGSVFTNINVDINEGAIFNITYSTGEAFNSNNILYIRNGFSPGTNYFYGKSKTVLENYILGSASAQPRNSYTQIKCINCTKNGVYLGKDVILEYYGSIENVQKSDFPISTDLPNAYCHKPNQIGQYTFRYEDYFIRNGESLRVNVKWLPGGEQSEAYITIDDLSIWRPNVLMNSFLKEENKPLAELHLKELSIDGWHSNQFSWTNNTSEDKQVRLWECVTGNINGGFLRTWKAGGGSL